MQQLGYYRLSEHRGRKRLWLEGLRLAAAGFAPGKTYTLTMHQDRGELELRLTDTGNRRVSRKQRHGNERPVIDISNLDLSRLFAEIDRVKVVVESGAIRVTVHPFDKQIRERRERLARKIAANEPLACGSIAHGGGVLDAALHHGLHDNGVATRLAWAIEAEVSYLQTALRNNPAWSNDTVPVHARMEEVEPGLLERIEVLAAGLPCQGASKAGRSKGKLACAEAHETAGAAFMAFLAIIRVTNPVAIVFENVPEYATSASMHVIRSVLTDWGYRLDERVLDGSMGTLEQRRRLCLVAVDESVPYDGARLKPTRQAESRLGDVLEPDVPAEAWRECAYLDAKEARDKAAGKGFRTQRVTPQTTTVGTIGRHYAKWRSTEPMLQHPTDPKLKRLLTVAEHAAVKAIPAGLVAGLPSTIAHQILGQSVLYPVFHAVGRLLGYELSQARAPSVKAKPTPVPASSHDTQQMAFAI